MSIFLCMYSTLQTLHACRLLLHLSIRDVRVAGAANANQAS
jgi:hypothetical protein